MHEIEMNEMSEAFFPCWRAAGVHLNQQVDGGIQTWLRATPNPPFLEHLSFRLGNQLFFIRVDDVDGKVRGPGNPRGVMTAAKMANGHACTLPMKRTLGDRWAVDRPGWGLLSAETGLPIDPVALITDQKIEMSEWEVPHMAVQTVLEHLEREGFKVMSWQTDPRVDPSIWFIGRTAKPEWVGVRSARFPANAAQRPGNWRDIAARCAALGDVGHFASVAFVSVDQPFESPTELAVPLWRGYGMHVRFTGLE